MEMQRLFISPTLTAPNTVGQAEAAVTMETLEQTL